MEDENIDFSTDLEISQVLRKISFDNNFLSCSCDSVIMPNFEEKNKEFTDE